MRLGDHASNSSGRSATARLLPVALGSLLLCGLAAGQEANAMLERARAVATSDVPEALRLVQGAIDAGLDRWDVHFLQAELLLRAGNAPGARDALARSQACLARDSALTEELRRRIELEAGRAGSPAPRPERAAGEPAAASAADLEALQREAKNLMEAGQLDAATESYSRVARGSAGERREAAKDRMVFGAKALAAQAKRNAAGDPAAARRDREAALRHAQTLHDELDDHDRALDAIAAVAESGDEETTARIGETLVAWIRDSLARAKAAAARGDEQAAREHRARARKTTARLFGMRTPDASRSAAYGVLAADLGALGDDGDLEQRRRELADQVAWLKRLVREGEEALRVMDRDLAKRKFQQVVQGRNVLVGLGGMQQAAEIDQSLAGVADPSVADAARKRLEEQREKLTREGRAAEEAGELGSAARLLASAYWQVVTDWRLGLDASALLIREGGLQEAMRIYEQVLRLADGEAQNAVRQRLAELRRWATESFLAKRAAFETALKEKRPAEALALIEGPLVVFDAAKWEALGEALREGLDIREPLAGMAAGLAAGPDAFPELAAPSPAGTATAEDGGVLVPGREFTAALGMRMIPVSSGASDSSEVMWVSADTIGDDEIAQYWEGLRSLQRDDGVTVSWNHAVMFCLYATQREREAGRLPPGYAYTLPTEAEWVRLHAGPLRGRPARGSGEFAHEWCLDRVDRDGIDQRIEHPGEPFEGKFRICRSTDPDPARARVCLSPDGNLGKRVFIRVVLTQRPEPAAPIAKPR